MHYEDILKLIIAALFGIVLGLERKLKRKPFGLKTCVTISVTSCLLTIVSIDSTLIAQPIAGIVRSDPMRLSAQIISGIGFLGAGVIMHKNNEVISGLTTAAMVWASSGLGIAIGAGFYIDTLIGLFLIIVSVELVPFIKRKSGLQVLREKEVTIKIVVKSWVNLRDITQKVSVLESKVDKIKTNELTNHTREVTLLCIVDQSIELMDLFDSIESMDGVLSVDTQRL